MARMDRDFRALLDAAWAEKKFLSVGLDTDFEKIPEHLRVDGVRKSVVAFNRAIVEATRDIANSYKINSAFYEERGDEGMAALRETIQHIRESAPQVPIILDAKRADIGNTNYGYVRAIFDHYGLDAVTVHPYLGREAMQPFLERKDKGIFVLCRTSNPGAGEFQDLLVDGEPLYLRVARSVAESWNENGNCMLVVGATYPEEMKKVRSVVGDMPFLIPGIGAQHGDVQKTVAAGKDAQGAGMLIAASRAIIYASHAEDYADAAKAAAQTLDAEIKAAL